MKNVITTSALESFVPSEFDQHLAMNRARQIMSIHIGELSSDGRGQLDRGGETGK